jgi:hypothetical protein
LLTTAYELLQVGNRFRVSMAGPDPNIFCFDSRCAV